VGVAPASLVAKIGCITNNTAFKVVGVGMGAMGSAAEMGQFAQAVSNGDGYGAVEHGMKALMGLLDTASAFGQACFAAGTPILTDEGWKPIEDVRRGDRVLSAPEDDPEAASEYRLVEETFQRYSPVMEVRVGGRTILTTAEHPFWVHGEGWRQAQQLKTGDPLRTHDGRLLPVEEAGPSREPTPVYNMRVAEYHTYFVGNPEWGFSVWAHNASYYNSKFRVNSVAETKALRREFNSTAKRAFIKNWTSSQQAKRMFSTQELAHIAKTGVLPNGANLVVHHITPLYRGGTNDFSNLRVMRHSFHHKFRDILHNYPIGQNPYGM